MSLIILYPLEETLNQHYGMILLFLYIYKKYIYTH